MSYLVLATSQALDYGQAISRVRTWTGAVQEALAYLEQGIRNVTITGDDGTVYGPNEFRLFDEGDE
jgi:hypothetical protein